MSEKAKNRQELEARIVAKAWQDEAYRARLLADPRAVLQEEIHADYPEVNLPEDLKVTVVAESVGELTLVLPVNPQSVAGEALSDESLDQAAGGLFGVVVVAGAPVFFPSVVVMPPGVVVNPIPVVVINPVKPVIVV